jgi:glycosyltransferase involved in cell wall biosynthesis
MLARRARGAAARVYAVPSVRLWPAHSRLFLPGDQGRWVLSQYADELAAQVLKPLGVRVAPLHWRGAARRQTVFAVSQFDALLRPPDDHRLGLAYLHGRPGTDNYPEFDACFAALRRRHPEIDRIQVTHTEMHEIVLSSGIEPTKVFRIPLGVDLDVMRLATPAHRTTARAALGLPRSAFVVGSFQKDGDGWGPGTVPKLVKGPDVLLAALERLRELVPELTLLLSGPARGFVRSGLERLGIPFVHVQPAGYAEVASLYHALDAYLVTSRQEGGPRAVLEAMATGVPLVSTRVGQATDLVRHGENGWLADVGDAETLAGLVAVAASAGSTVRDEARRTAEAHRHGAQLPLWHAFMDGFVERSA